MNKGDETIGNQSKFMSDAQDMKAKLGPGLCLAKWQQVSLHLTTGMTNSCYHPPLHTIDPELIQTEPSALHNTEHKKLQRKIMLKNEKPSECSYCWNMESLGELSDRHYRSGEPWAAEHFDTIVNSTGDENVIPSYVEVNFSNVCNLKCSYCSPQFSSTWQQEVDRWGGYPTSTTHNDPSHFTGRNRPIPAREDNPYVEAFWQWWPELYPKLKHFRMTGGEPLMDKNTFKVLDYVNENPHGQLELSITSNMCPPDQKLFDKFVEKVKAIETLRTYEDKENFNEHSGNHWYVDKGFKHFWLFVSLDGFGEQAEYMRTGLEFERMLNNVKTFLRETKYSTVSFINTFNILSIPSLHKFLAMILELRKEFGGRSQVEFEIAPEQTETEKEHNIVHKAYKQKKFKKEFFDKPKDEVCGEMKRELSLYLGSDYDVSHFEALHDLGYLPIHVKALEEGTLAPIRVPVLTIYNTHPDFYWVTNYLETILSNLLWKPMTSATIAHTYRKVLTKWQEKTDTERGWFIDWQGHDFSMRGMDSVDAVISSGLGHLTSFSGTDSLPTLHGARKYYGEEGFVGGSVNATEHSVMCAGGADDEVGTFRRLLETYPTGILSVVSDTWDLWKVCTEHVVTLKEEILARDGKLVIRPDSGDPVDIICGNGKEVDAYNDVNGREYNESKGVIELLWDVFGGTVNEQGYKVLDSHIGAIYGDSITIDRADEICKRLEAKGFASTNVVLGIGSFTYQYNTRDTFGFAMKATYVEVMEEKITDYGNPGTEAKVRVKVGREIFKDPITDDGTKKSVSEISQL